MGNIIYLNALYNGLYQHRKEHGVNSTKNRIETPNVTAEELSALDDADAMKYPREAITLMKRIPVYTANETCDTMNVNMQLPRVSLTYLPLAPKRKNGERQLLAKQR